MNSIISLTISEFEKLLKSKDWTHNSKVYEIDSYLSMIEDEEGDICAVTCVYGGCLVESILGNITVKYNEGYEYVSGDKDSFITSTEGMEAPWVVDGFSIVDDAGEPIDFDFESLPSEFSAVDYELVKSGI